MGNLWLLRDAINPFLNWCSHHPFGQSTTILCNLYQIIGHIQNQKRTWLNFVSYLSFPFLSLLCSGLEEHCEGGGESILTLGKTFPTQTYHHWCVFSGPVSSSLFHFNTISTLFSPCYLASPAKITSINLFVLESWQVQDTSQALFEYLKNDVQQQFLGLLCCACSGTCQPVC